MCETRTPVLAAVYNHCIYFGNRLERKVVNIFHLFQATSQVTHDFRYNLKSFLRNVLLLSIYYLKCHPFP